jgi:hypothetical protein
MEERRPGRFEVIIIEGPPHGDLYELEQTTTYQVIDTQSQKVVVEFEGETSARLSTDSGLWDDYRTYGVCDVRISPDGQSAIVEHCDGRVEEILLPPQVGTESG